MSQPLSSKLSAGIAVWPVWLNTSEATLQLFEGWLSPDEIARADSFRFPHLRSRFVSARAMLRLLLAHERGAHPRTLTFDYGPFGKPSLSDDPRLAFNVSHTSELAVFAIAWERELGIDVEKVQPLAEMLSLAGSHFSRTEIAALHSLPTEQQQRAFFLCWTRKEAYVKATGQGLGVPLQSFTVSLNPNEPACLSLAGTHPSWSVQDLPLLPDYAAALVYSGSETGVEVKTLCHAESLLDVLSI